MFTITFIHTDGTHQQVSRYFETKRAALKLAKWMRSQNFVTETSVYHGPAGGDLLERATA
jgi:hypothetical protein